MAVDHATGHAARSSMQWLDQIERAASLPAAWLIATDQMPRTRPERSALRHGSSAAVLSRQLALPPAAIRLDHDQAGRPRIVSPDATGLNLSHATRDGMVLVALANGPVGADIERIGAGPIPWAALHRAEQTWLGQVPEAERELAFATLWATKEAHGKWAGTGLPETDRIAVLPGSDGRWHVAGEEGIGIHTRIFTHGDRRYAAAVVLTAPMLAP
ncbi:MAG: 4'-phosphopantetheinyl transferase superfamily protein [Beijerinckiaceae bacterium]|nr:4'-phosphopantetheinyl transferase superfamily protein [Beijerinckiaceae bacterium]